MKNIFKMIGTLFARLNLDRIALKMLLKSYEKSELVKPVINVQTTLIHDKGDVVYVDKEFMNNMPEYVYVNVKEKDVN